MAILIISEFWSFQEMLQSSATLTVLFIPPKTELALAPPVAVLDL